MIGLRLETGSDRETLVHGLEQLGMEDPTLSVHTDQRSGEVVIAGMGELQLEIAVTRLQREFGVDVRRTRPRPAYREILTQPTLADVWLCSRVARADPRARNVFARVRPI